MHVIGKKAHTRKKYTPDFTAFGCAGLVGILSSVSRRKRCFSRGIRTCLWNRTLISCIAALRSHDCRREGGASSSVSDWHSSPLLNAKRG